MNRNACCILCHASIDRSVPELPGYRRCRMCDVTWYVDTPADNAGDSDRLYYGDWDRDYYGDSKIFGFHTTRKSAFEAIVARLGAVQPNRGRLLDVGTGLGILLHAAAQDGWLVEGVEPSGRAAKWASKATGAVVYNGFLEELKLPDAQYDAITMVDVLRSIPNLLTFLHCVRRLLRPGGVLVVRESNRKIMRHIPRLKEWLKGNAVGQDRGAIRRGVAYQDFSPKSLHYAFQKVGLEGWVEPSPVFTESTNARGGRLMIPLLKRGSGLASAAVYRVSVRRIIISPGLLGFGRAPTTVQEKTFANVAYAMSSQATMANSLEEANEQQAPRPVAARYSRKRV